MRNTLGSTSETLAGAVRTVVQIHSLAQLPHRRTSRSTLDLGQVLLGDTESGMGQTVGERAVVGEKQKPLGVHVEAPDRVHQGLGWHQIHHGAATMGVRGGRDDARRLVQQPVNESGVHRQRPPRRPSPRRWPSTHDGPARRPRRSPSPAALRSGPHRSVGFRTPPGPAPSADVRLPRTDPAPPRSRRGPPAHVAWSATSAGVVSSEFRERLSCSVSTASPGSAASWGSRVASVPSGSSARSPARASRPHRPPGRSRPGRAARRGSSGRVVRGTAAWCRTSMPCPGPGSSADLVDVATLGERSHHAVDVDASDRSHLRPTDGLLVGDDRQGLQRSGRQARRLARSARSARRTRQRTHGSGYRQPPATFTSAKPRPSAS